MASMCLACYLACTPQEPRTKASAPANGAPRTPATATSTPAAISPMTAPTYGPPPTASDRRAYEATSGERSFRARSVPGYHGASSSCTIVTFPAGEVASAAESAIVNLKEACSGILASQDLLVVLADRGVYGYSLRGEPRFSVPAQDARWPAVFTPSHVFARTADGIVRIDHQRGILTQTWPYPASVQVRVLAPDGEQMYALLHVQETSAQSVSRLVQLMPTVPPIETRIRTVRDVRALNPAIRPMGTMIESRLDTEWYRDAVPSGLHK